MLPAPKILKLPANGTSAPPLLPVKLVTPPDELIDWKDGSEVAPLEVRTNPAVPGATRPTVAVPSPNTTLWAVKPVNWAVKVLVPGFPTTVIDPVPTTLITPAVGPTSPPLLPANSREEPVAAWNVGSADAPLDVRTNPAVLGAARPIVAVPAPRRTLWAVRPVREIVSVFAVPIVVMLPVPRMLKLPANGTSAPPLLPVNSIAAPEELIDWKDGSVVAPLEVRTNPAVLGAARPIVVVPSPSKTLCAVSPVSSVVSVLVPGVPTIVIDPAPTVLMFPAVGPTAPPLLPVKSNDEPLTAWNVGSAVGPLEVRTVPAVPGATKPMVGFPSPIRTL